MAVNELDRAMENYNFFMNAHMESRMETIISRYFITNGKRISPSHIKLGPIQSYDDCPEFWIIPTRYFFDYNKWKQEKNNSPIILHEQFVGIYVFEEKSKPGNLKEVLEVIAENESTLT